MKSKYLLALTFFSSLSLIVSAHLPGPQKVFYQDKTIETNAGIIKITDAVSDDVVTKFRINVTNKLQVPVVLDASQIKVILNGQEQRAIHERKEYVRVGDSESRVIDFRGDYRGSVIQIKVDGLAEVNMGKPLNAPAFHLPPSSNNLSAGNVFKAVLHKDIRTTDLVEEVFSTTYTGRELGVVDPSYFQLKMKTGNVYANMRGNQRMIFFEPGVAHNVAMAWKKIPVSSGDTQFAEMDILMSEAFYEAKLTPVNVDWVTLEIDTKRTK